MVNGDLDVIVDILCIADIPAIISLIKLIALRYYSKGMCSESFLQ